MPDNPISTPLPADLPVNWQTGQIVAPNGADVGLSAQHGYNYLMQQLNAAQQAVNTLGQAIAALTGEDIPTSGTDSTTIAAALSKKADATPPQEYDLPLAEGLTGDCYYSKTQEGLVLVRISIVVGAEVGAQAVIGTLPAGYRPANDVAVSALAGVSGAAIATPLGIYANGTIMNIGQAIPADASNRIYGEALFVAAN